MRVRLCSACRLVAIGPLHEYELINLLPVLQFLFPEYLRQFLQLRLLRITGVILQIFERVDELGAADQLSALPNTAQQQGEREKEGHSTTE